MVTKRADNGKLYKEPPYTDEELEEIYKSLGPPTIVASSRPRGTPQAPAPQEPQQPPAKARRGSRRPRSRVNPAGTATDNPACVLK
jgi:hypothetical protein